MAQFVFVAMRQRYVTERTRANLISPSDLHARLIPPCFSLAEFADRLSSLVFPRRPTATIGDSVLVIFLSTKSPDFPYFLSPSGI